MGRASRARKLVISQARHDDEHKEERERRPKGVPALRGIPRRDGHCGALVRNLPGCEGCGTCAACIIMQASAVTM